MATAKKAPAAESPEAVFQAALEPIANIQEKVRQTTEKGLEQARAQYEAVKEAAEKATGKIEESLNAAQSGIRTFNLKALDQVRANTNAAFDHVQALFATQTPADFFTLQGEFLKKQAETLTAQVKELADLGQKLAVDAAEPVKSALVVPFKK